MSTRLHIGAQSIYLRDWINMDVPGVGLAVDYPLRVAANITDESDYYGRKGDKTPETVIRDGPESNTGDVCDVYGTWQQMPFDDNSIDEILSRQCFEHLSRPETMAALLEARRVLKMGGILRLDVPDLDQTLAEWERAIREHEFEKTSPGGTQRAAEQAQIQIDLMKRHLLGSRKNDWAVHLGGWTQPSLIEFCKRYGFNWVGDEPNIHFYPAICCRFQKGPLPHNSELSDAPIISRQVAWEYCAPGGGKLEKTDGEILEVGPGRCPWPSATTFVDIDDANILRMKELGFDVHHSNVENLPSEWTDRFSYVLASHVLEHTDNPLKAAAELSRVAKAGCVVCPSPMKEGLFCAHETDHRWHVLSGQDCLYFRRIPLVVQGDARPVPLYEYIYNADVAGEQHRLWRYGEPRLEGLSRTMREWWHKVEPHFDVIHHWEGQLKIIVLE